MERVPGVTVRAHHGKIQVRSRRAAPPFPSLPWVPLEHRPTDNYAPTYPTFVPVFGRTRARTSTAPSASSSRASTTSRRASGSTPRSSRSPRRTRTGSSTSRMCVCAARSFLAYLPASSFGVVLWCCAYPIYQHQDSSPSRTPNLAQHGGAPGGRRHGGLPGPGRYGFG